MLMLHVQRTKRLFLNVDASCAKNKSPSLSDNEKDIARKVKVSCTSKVHSGNCHSGHLCIVVSLGKPRIMMSISCTLYYVHKVVIWLTDYTLS